MIHLGTKWWGVGNGTAAVLLGVLLSAPAQANIGPRWWGDYGLEPQGVKDVRITRENLTIDLRPLAHVEPVRVEAKYFLDNPGSVKKLDLVFVSGTPEVTDFEVRLNDRPVPFDGSAGRKVGVPKEWYPPRSLQGIVWESTYPWYRTQMGRAAFQAFSLELPSGAATLQVRYRARAAGADENYPTATWQFPYVLAPARAWGSFGRLEVSAPLPDGWECKSRPDLRRDGAVLHGSFEGLPADFLVFTLRKPVGAAEVESVQNRYLGFYVGPLLLGGLLCWWLGAVGGRRLGGRLAANPRGRGRALFWIWLLAACCALGWSVLLFAGWSLAWDRILNNLEGQESPYAHEKYGLPRLGTLLLTVLIIPVGFWLTWVRAFRACRRAGGGLSSMADGMREEPCVEP
jgi:hypothetical protein